MKKCPECNSNRSVYSRRDHFKCYKCGYVYKHKLIGDSVPTRESNSKCGDIISNYFDGVSRACVQKKVYTDGTACSITPTTVKHLKNRTYMVACTFDKD